MKSEVFNMDCMIGMAQYPDKYFDLAVVDPPYGIGVNNMTLGNGKNKIYRGSELWDIKIPDNLYFDELFRISVNQVIWGANYMTLHIPPKRGWLFWDKGTGDNDYSDGELAFTSYDCALKKIKKSWVGNNAKDECDRIHPTQKPIYVYEYIYKKFIPQGGKVIDTHLGSGSNRIAADKAGNIDFVGYELDKDYFEAQEKRWKNYKAQLVMNFDENKF